MTESGPDLGQAARIYWLVTWRTIVGGALIGGVLGLVIGFCGAVLHTPRATMSLITTSVGALVVIPWSIFVIRMAIRKQYRGFRLMIVRT